MRKNVVKVMLSDTELQLIDEKRAGIPRAKFLREQSVNSRALHSEMKKQNNKELLIALARIGSNVHQITKVLNAEHKINQGGVRYKINYSQLIDVLTDINLSLEDIVLELSYAN